jgi:hypothetical protein
MHPYRSSGHPGNVMTRDGGAVLVAGLGSVDPLRLLLRDAALIIVSDPCGAHRAAFELRLAALKCLAHREFLQLGRRDRWARLCPRIRWLVPERSVLAWDGAVEALGAFRAPRADEFELMKERAPRLELVSRPLHDLLSMLPGGFADGLFPGSACGSDPSRLAAEARRVLRRPAQGPTSVETLRAPVPAEAT